MTGILAAIAGSGLGALETQTLTVGASGSFVYGYDAANFGSISPGTSTIYSGSSWVALYHSDFDGQTILELNAVVANSGWTTMNINGAVFDRASAISFTSGFTAGGPISQWVWFGAGFGRTPSPTIVAFR